MQYLGNFDQQRLHQIQALNPTLSDPNDIQPGQKILLPGPVAENATPPTNVRNIP
jgi:LysM repeat protein